jgi:UDP-2,3-diacylglucosamine pyrophosphatase LpxH
MLVFLSDLHLTDASTSGNVHPEALTSVLLDDIVDAVESKQAAELHIVLLGDIFDLVRTDYWVRQYLDAPPAEQNARKAELPWNGSLHPDTALNKNSSPAETGYQNIQKSIFGQPVFAALANFLQGAKALTDRKGIPLRLTYVIGNHDRVLYNFPSLQATISQELRRRANIDVQFARELRLSDYDVLARHGHVWDSECHGYDLYVKVLHPGESLDRFSETVHNVQTFGEMVTAELMSGLVHRVHARLRKDGQLENRKFFLDAIKDINNVRPYTQILNWLTWKLAGTYDDYEKNVLMAAVKETALAVANTELFKLWRQTCSPVTRTLLATAERLLKWNWNVDIVMNTLGRFSSDSGKKDAYAGHAEEEIKAGGMQYVLYGHTHDAKSVYFSGQPDNRVQMYLNTGTYLPLIWKAETNGFAFDYRMTITFFYLPSEDNRNGNKKGGVSMEFWNGQKRKTYAV